MLAPTILALLGVSLLAALSFFFAVAESALFSLGKWRARRLEEQSPIEGRLVVKLLSAPEDLLATLVLGNTFANAALIALGLWMSLHERHWSLPATIVFLLGLVLIVGEVVPKALAVRAPDPWALRVASPLWLLMRVMRPLRQVAQRMNTAILRVTIPKSVRPHTRLNEDDYQELLELAVQQGTLAKSELEIILEIIRLDRRTVREVMKPRSQMACVPDDLSVEDMIAAARQHQHRRLPIYDDTPDTIVGILNTRRLLLDPQIDLAEVIEFPSFVPASMNLLQLFQSFQRQQRGLAIVVDEFGGTAGVVTIEDILEEIIGEIRSEGAPAGFVMEKLGPGRWRVNGTMRIDDFRREFPELGAVPPVETMGGLLVALCEVVPAVNQSVHFNGLKLTATAADERRVRELLVTATRKKGGD
ncbi:hemolysin [Verrucomicrobiota bacterium]|nr:hemolysin [Verrucomicrobiota bacterium]